MICSCVKKLFLIVFFITFSCETKDTCNESCLSKTYSCKDGDKVVFSVTFTAQQFNGLSLLNVNLFGHGYANESHQRYSVSINSGPDTNRYYCERVSSGIIRASIEGPKKQFVSYSYRNDTANCYFTLSREDSTWPMDKDGIKLDLEVNPDYQIISADMYNHVIEIRTKDLPIYHMKFLRCCNKVYGDDKAQLIIRQTDHSNEFTLLLLDDAASVVLTGSDDSPLVFYCNFKNQFAYASFKMDGIEAPIDSQVHCLKVNYARLCSWSIPIVVSGLFGIHDTINFVYNLQISNGDHTYKEIGISLKGSDSTQISQAVDTCDGSCLTKTYFFKDVAAVTFAAKQIRVVNYLTINLVGYNINETQYNQVSVSLNSILAINKYFCERNTSGSTSAYFNGTGGIVIDGTSIYRDNTLYCSWTISRVLNNYPRNSQGQSIDLEVYSDFEIILANKINKLTVASSNKDLPIYGMKFLKCCDKVYGDDKFQLIARETDNSNEFTLLNFDNTPGTVVSISVQFMGSDGSQLMFECSFEPEFINGYLKTDGQEVSISSQFLYSKVIQHSKKCSWSIPIVFRDHDTRNHVYDLQISDGDHTYTKSGVSLRSSDSTLNNLKNSSLKQFSNMLVVFLVFWFRQIM